MHEWMDDMADLQGSDEDGAARGDFCAQVAACGFGDAGHGLYKHNCNSWMVGWMGRGCCLFV